MALRRHGLVHRGLAAGAGAGVVSGVPSTVHALLGGRSPLESTRAAGTLLGSPTVAAGLAAHAALSLGWGLALAAVLPRRRAVLWGAVAGLAIAALDLGAVGRRFPRIRALPIGPQVADHLAYGVTVAVLVSARRTPAGPPAPPR